MSIGRLNIGKTRQICIPSRQFN